MSIVYKCKTTNSTFSTVNLDEFIGYKIQKESDKLSSIIELDKQVIKGTIKYRPTQIPLINTVQYNGYTEERYNNNMIRTIHYTWNNQIYGEYRKYNPNGDLIDKKYYYASEDITNDIMNFIRFTGDTSDFKYYEFQEDELFNVMIRYGSYFKLFDEYNMDSKQFDSITKYCLE